MYLFANFWHRQATGPAPRKTYGLEAKDPISREGGRHKEWFDGSGEHSGKGGDWHCSKIREHQELAVPVPNFLFGRNHFKWFHNILQPRKSPKYVCDAKPCVWNLMIGFTALSFPYPPPNPPPVYERKTQGSSIFRGTSSLSPTYIYISNIHLPFKSGDFP